MNERDDKMNERLEKDLQILKDNVAAIEAPPDSLIQFLEVGEYGNELTVISTHIRKSVAFDAMDRYSYRIQPKITHRPMNREEWKEYIENEGWVRSKSLTDIAYRVVIVNLSDVKTGGLGKGYTKKTFPKMCDHFTRMDGSPLTVEITN